MLFSQRKGLKPIKNIIQVDNIDEDLRIGLWNLLTIYYWEQVKRIPSRNDSDLKLLIDRLWVNYYKLPLDSLSNKWDDIYKYLREYFFNCHWYETYDFIEFITANYTRTSVNDQFILSCNSLLEKELSAYRFVGGKITEITSEEEISEIEEALNETTRMKNVNVHLKRALELISDRKSPDYRNSMKESISAVETMCCIIKGEKATLGQALKVLKDRIDLHSALENAFSMLYGYSSDADGIRHSLMEESSLEFEDAKFMLVSCSAFINYLLAKSAKAGINI